MSKKRGLGKGLQALIPMAKEGEAGGERLKEIEMARIRPAPGQARKLFDRDKLNELAASIKEHGVIQPVVVRPLGEGGYELVAGERRWRACQLLGYSKIPAVVKECRDMEAVEVSLIENVQRQDLNPLEEASAYSKLMEKYGLTQEDVSARVGKSRPFIANAVRLLDLSDEIKEMLKDGRLSAGHARALLALKDAKQQVAAAGKIAGQQLSVRQAEQMVKKILAEKDVRREESVGRSRYISEAEDKLKRIFGAGAKIRETRRGGGTLEIKFKNREDLQRLLIFLTDDNKQNVSRETI